MVPAWVRGPGVAAGASGVRGFPAAGLDQAGFAGEHDGLGPVMQAELAEDPRDVGLDRGVAEEQLTGDVGVGHAPHAGEELPAR